MPINVFVPSVGEVSITPCWPCNGAPTSGTSGTLAGVAAKGDLLSDYTNGTLYQNTGTSASPTWSPSAANGSAVAITGGSIDGTSVGGTTAAAGKFTSVAASGLVSESAATGLTAVGTTQANALQLAANINNVTTVASGTGVKLPAPVAGMKIVFNVGANTLAVYGNGSDTIDGTAGATGVTLTAAHRVATFYAVSATAWRSVLGGAVSS